MTPYRSFVDRFEKAVRDLRARYGHGRCAAGCSGCCRTRSALPVEALPLLDHLMRLPAADRIPPAARGESCPFLLEGGRCSVFAARPFVCRTHGLPILFLNPEGAWSANGCPREVPHLVDAAETDAVFPLHLWNAELHRINAAFCDAFAIRPSRIPISGLACAPEAYLPLLEKIPERERRTWISYPSPIPL